MCVNRAKYLWCCHVWVTVVWSHVHTSKDDYGTFIKKICNEMSEKMSVKYNSVCIGINNEKSRLDYV